MKYVLMFCSFLSFSCAGQMVEPTANLGPLQIEPKSVGVLAVGVPVRFKARGGNGLYSWRYETGGSFRTMGNEAEFVPLTHGNFMVSVSSMVGRQQQQQVVSSMVR